VRAHASPVAPASLLRDPYAGPTGLGEGVIWRVGLETWLD
jgi:hypothetical protein